MSARSPKENSQPRYRIAAIIGSIAWAILIFVLSAIPTGSYQAQSTQPSIFSYVVHFCIYAIFAALLTIAVHDKKRKLWQSALIAAAIGSLFGASDEMHQFFVPGHECSPIDWLKDTFGSIAGAFTTIFLASFLADDHSEEDSQ